jgi:hypothetical protein
LWSGPISPEPKTGIGAWSDELFDRALREGKALYPAMPASVKAPPVIYSVMQAV